eukprot:CAMPEP_0119059318 /NCGR_PEP_ID=MMETSP1178-20130426/3506_1 /TAXON_ID=33656 /ORGANISM="unid sp, Strain CCMP2000" /LENGTH=166 /DNA_ID=CAMNT_0007040345 /DNA_START=37 /DNA_END=537 /DNA_ORIENTATION=-
MIAPSTKGVTKNSAKPTKRKLIPTWDRVDNNLALVSKCMGYKRTKAQKRDIKAVRLKVMCVLAKLDLAHLDLRFTNVHNTLQSVNNQPGIKRAIYPLEFKKSLMWMCNEGASILKSACAGVATFDGFAGFDFMNCCLDGDVSVTSENTTAWSIPTVDTCLPRDFGF